MTVANRRLREQQLRREVILEAANSLFANKGFEATTVDEIAAKAELGKGTIYSYFKSKEEIFIAILESGLAILENRMNQVIEENSSAIDALYCLYDTFITYHHERKGFIETLFVQADQQLFLRLGGLVTRVKLKVANWRELVGKVLQKGIDSGELKEFNVEKMSKIIVGMIVGIIIQQEMGQTMNLADYRDSVFQLTLEGLKMN